MEKQLTIGAYWAGIASTVLALLTRALALFGLFTVKASEAMAVPVTYRTFLEGAELFFLMAIAGSTLSWVRGNRA
jgi:hypothetical protein